MPTMIRRDLETLGSEMISFYDKFLTKQHYECLSKCNKTSSAKCDNGGYRSPKNCSRCVCPIGYGGRL
ncbi:hypothetical protein Angca_007720 [Angiostrongylus cantonensis]|nr:hypothetical protein Angca_007720 [Angiostrongylus cantonensis]